MFDTPKYLYKTLLEELGRKQIEEKTTLPYHLTSNLNPRLVLRPYQEQTFRYFINYWNEDFANKPAHNHQLLFHMATGSGKTLIMAGLIVYLYEQGYRNFLFFVNSDNIINKTRDNFLNALSSKYLFANTISIADKQVRIKEVDNFQAANPNDINLVFSTIQGLHSRLNTPRENSLTYDDFEDTRLVLLSDEAHHINAETKKGVKKQVELKLDADVTFDKLDYEEKEIVSWEQTVNRIFTANKQNVLLEFTATMDLDNTFILDKYADKLVFDYPLKKFRNDGYSKEVKILQSDLSRFDRALQAVLLSQYRRKIFEKYHKVVKPVILFKSKTISESKAFFDEFVAGMKKLHVDNIAHIKQLNDYNTEAYKTLFDKGGNLSLANLFKYLDDNNISLENFIIELKEDFSEDKLISVNSKDESVAKQLAVNSLEDENNEYRIVFAVDKLNEGWDVLNLYDIVRLYNTRDVKDGKPGKGTMSEAQLIGRGARYNPVQFTEDEPADQRKYDSDIQNEKRITEELVYHSEHNPRYIQELNTALVEIGIKPKTTKEQHLTLKEPFKESSFYEKGFIYLNRQEKYDRSDIIALPNIPPIEVRVKTGYTKSSVAFDNTDTAKEADIITKDYRLHNFGETIVRKALNKLVFYEFANLKKYLPNLNTIRVFIESDNYLAKIIVSVKGLDEQVRNLDAEQKLAIAIEVLDKLIPHITSVKIGYKGSKDFTEHFVKDIFTDKTQNFAVDYSEDKEYGRSMLDTKETKHYLDLSKLDWYVFEDCFGTSEEKLFIHYLNNVVDSLRVSYDEIYLVRNEKHFKIYDFDSGRALEPDFVLFLSNSNDDVRVYYQVFIEPKGGHLFKNDEWKEQFLQRLKAEHQIKQLWRDREYTIWGMPFYNRALRSAAFDDAFKQLIV
jgi:type III restriction enzyme